MQLLHKLRNLKTKYQTFYHMADLSIFLDSHNMECQFVFMTLTLLILRH